MTALRAILVDDEESARNILKNLLQRFCPTVELVASYQNIPDAVDGIKLHAPDLVFLDIEMPVYAGFEIVDFFQEVNFEIVFITAYDQYAIKAFEVSAVDYLLKPIEISRLIEAVDRVQSRQISSERATRMSHLAQTLKEDKIASIVLAEKGLQHVIALEDVISFEAQESYCTIHTEKRKFVASKNLKHFETLLEEHSNFIRVHKSWIINIDYLLNYSRSQLEIHLENSITAKLSKYKKADFEKVLQTVK